MELSNWGTSGACSSDLMTSVTCGRWPFREDDRTLRVSECSEGLMKNLRTGEDVCDCIVAGLGSVGDSGIVLLRPSSTAREFCCS